MCTSGSHTQLLSFTRSRGLRAGPGRPAHLKGRPLRCRRHHGGLHLLDCCHVRSGHCHAGTTRLWFITGLFSLVRDVALATKQFRKPCLYFYLDFIHLTKLPIMCMPSDNVLVKSQQPLTLCFPLVSKHPPVSLVCVVFHSDVPCALQVVGHKEGLDVMERADPLFLLIGLPTIPVMLILGKMIRWEDYVLRLWRKYSNKLQILNSIFPGQDTH